MTQTTSRTWIVIAICMILLPFWGLVLTDALKPDRLALRRECELTTPHVLVATASGGDCIVGTFVESKP